MDQNQQAARPDVLLQFNGRRQLPVILQTEVAECGLACLAMVVGYYGFDTDILHLRQRYAISSRGAQLKAIIDIATDLHFSCRALRCEFNDLQRITTPCILHWGMNHFVVLKAIKKKHILIHDPSFGKKRLTYTNFNEQFTGIALELIPTPQFKQQKKRLGLKFSHFWTKAIGLKSSLLQLIALSFLLQLFMLASPFYLQTVVDDVLLSRDQALLITLAIGFGLLLVVDVTTTAVREYVILSLSNRMSIQMSANLFHNLIRLPINYFIKRHIGDIVSRFSSLDEIRSALTSTLVVALVDGVMTLLTLIVMFAYNATLAMVTVGLACSFAVFRLFTFNSFKNANMEAIVAAAKENSHFLETVRAIQTIKIFEMENDRQYQWQNRLANRLNKQILVSRWNIHYKLLHKILFGIENIIVVYLAAMAVISEQISLGMLYAYMAYKLRFSTTVDSLITQWMQFKLLDLHMTRLADIAFSQPQSANEEHIKELIRDNSRSITGKIEVKSLGYRYNQYEPWIFRNINLTIEPGESVALTGPSGCGKTTLIKCLIGLITPTEGEILVDGIPINNLPQYQHQIAAVMQEDKLLAGDIANNIACFELNIDMDKVKKVANLACIHQDIQRLPMGYHSLVGDMGAGLSGGQKQRIFLARALYRSPQILFMDEATSHLDTLSESTINENIKALNITRVFAAHREKTIASANRKIIL